MHCKTVIMLKQQTPYIHFQHFEKGATLRATEVKPKLDRFLVKKLGGIGSIDKTWIVKDNTSTAALNYKIRFTVSGTPIISTSGEAMCIAIDESYDENTRKAKSNASRSAINGMYFANMVSGTNYQKPLSGMALANKQAEIRKAYKETVFYKTPVTMTVICFIPELLKLIQENVQEFFAVENFGSRQSKGFGGFVVTEIDGERFHYENVSTVEKLLGKRLYFYSKVAGAGVSDMLVHAQNVSAILKGGLNMTGWNDKIEDYKAPKNYIKGYIQRAFLNEKYGVGKKGSEKAYIKSRKPISSRAVLTNKRKENDVIDKKYGSYVFVRAILGLADHYEFRSLREGNVNVYSLGENDFDICRFKSPITIKIIGDCMYFVFDMERFPVIVGKKFYLLDESVLQRYEKDLLKSPEKSKYPDKKKLIESKGYSIETPDCFGEAEVITLIKGYVKYFNEEKARLTSFAPQYKKSSEITLVVGGSISE